MINAKLQMLNVENGHHIQRGQSLFEVIFALGIAAIILIAMASLATTTLRNSTFSNDSAIATQLAAEVTEWLRSERDENWSSFAGRSSVAGRTWCLPTLSWPAVSGPCSGPIPGANYTRSVILESVDANPTPQDGIIDTINATVTVSWTDSQGTHDITNNASYTDWRR